MTQLRVVPIGLRAANDYVVRVHRHHGPVRGHKWSIALVDDAGTLHGVAIAGRPLARQLDDGLTLEILRCATIGTRNACSMLYGAAWRAARAMGYRRAITYTLADAETGKSLRASGWRLEGRVRGDSWHRADRPRLDSHPTTDKLRWMVSAP